MTILVCLVAGMSSRFGGKPKQLERVGPNNETLIEYSINQALNIDLEKIIFVTNQKTHHLFVELFGYEYKNISIYYSTQMYDTDIRTRPWGTLDAICCAAEHINSNFIVINGDDIYGIETFKTGYKDLNKGLNTIGLVETIKTLPNEGCVNRGIVNVDKNRVKSLIEKLGISIKDIELRNTLSNVNFLCFQPEILYIFKKYLEQFKLDNSNDPEIEILLPDILNKMIENNEVILYYFQINNNILGITNPQDSANLKALLAK